MPFKNFQGQMMTSLLLIGIDFREGAGLLVAFVL